MLRFNQRRFCSLIAIAAVVLLMLAALDVRLTVRKYEIDAAEITAPVRLALITDLHSCRYGEAQSTLIGAVRSQEPDVVLLGGDIFDDKIENTNAEKLIAGIADQYPCYYVTGNHEHWSSEEHFAQQMDILAEYGIPVLGGRCEKLRINGQEILLGGVNDPSAYADTGKDERTAMAEELDALREMNDGQRFSILLSHRPEFFETYLDCGFDLILCGHAHGGQWRIPGMLNGLFAPNQGLFPEYAGGMYEQDGVRMIVSRGLARESTRVPRVFNRPELVIIDVN